MKHLLSSFMLFLILFIGHSSYVKGDTTIASGTIDGTSIQWSVTSSDGTQENLKLSITGSGAIPSYLSSFSPWENYSQKTTEIYVAPTITEIGDYAFYQTAITSFEIPSSCTKIGSSAFIHCTKLKEIYIPSNVESIGAMAFKGCSSLSLIHYDGRCTSKTIISSNANDLGVANGKIIEKEGTGSSYAFIPDGWEYYTHGEKCKGGAWVAESGTGYERKLFFYAQKSGATVNYVVNGNAATTSPECHPWRVNCEKYISLEINKNISAISNTELTGYIDGSNAMTGYKNIQSITVESGNPSYVVGDEGALYDKAKTKILLYPAKSTATNVDVPATVSKIGSCAFFGAKNLKSINFLGTITSIENSAFAQASSLNYMYFVAETAPASYSKSAFVNLPSTGVVLANAESDAWNKFTNTIGSGWTFNVGIYSYISSDGTLYVEGRGAYTTSSSNASWYSQRGSIKKIVVKEGITNIGSNAFANCSYVTEVTLNNTGTVDYYAFRDCSALTRVNVGSGVTEFKSDNYLDVVYMHPFSGCSKLATINVTDLKAFCAIKGLEYLTDKTYGTAAVKTLMVNGSTHSSTSELVIPEGMTEIPNVAFRYFSNVTKIKFPSTMETIYSKNFKYHDYLTEITVPSTVSSVGSEAFSYCDALKTVTLNNKGNIGKSAFQGCKALQTVTLNNKGTIGIQAFWFCSALTRVNIGSGVKGFDYDTSSSFYDTFSNCSNLSIVNVTDLKAYCTITGLAYLTDSSKGTASNKTLMINGSVHSSTSELVIPEGVTEIPNAAFRYFSNVTKIKFPSTMETISPSNFSGYFYLTEITVPSTVSSVGSDAFSYCTSLKTAILNNKGNIGNSAFEGCKTLQTVTLNNSGSIGKAAFWYCSALTRVNIGSGVTGFNYGSSSYDYPFYACSELATVNVTDLKAYCSISGIQSLTLSSYGTAANKTLMINGVVHSSTSELVIPEGVTEIKNGSFRTFSNVTRIKLPSSLKAIGVENFSGHSYLTEITVPSTVSSVGSEAFSYCTSLKTATLNNKGSIGNSAFEGCSALETVTLNNNGSIGKKAFWYCSALSCVNIGSGVTRFNYASSSYDYPFYACSELAAVNVTDLKAYCAISGLEYLNNSSYGTAKDKTLMVNSIVCSSTSELVIPEGVTSISPYAFYNFKNLTNVRIPSTVTSIGNYAFSSSTNLERIICLAPTCPLTGDYLATNADNITLKVPGGTASLYKSAKVWKEFNIVEGNLKSSYGTMLARQSRTFSIDSEVLAWSVSDESVATLNGNKVTAKNFVYDGTTELPYKSVVVTAILENCDRYVWNIKVYPREVSLTDGNAYKNTEDVDVPKISYTRTFADKVVNKWQCFYVPFDIEITDELLEDFDFAELYMVSYFDADENGEIEDGEPLRMTFCRLYAGKTLHANTPYYVRVKSSGTKTFEVTNTTLMAAANGSVDCSTTKHVYSLVGIYEPTYMQGRYGMALNGGFTYVTNPTTKLGAYRWYMEVKSRTGELENLARPIEIYVEGDEETTGIVALEDKASAPQNDKVFTLDGRQENNTDNLPSGMYIINGKKVFKK